MEQERKLAEYRARKKKEQQIQHYKQNIKNLFKWKQDAPSTENEPMIINEESEPVTEISTENISREITREEPDTTSKLRKEYYIFFGLLWAAMYIVFIKLQFGIIYLIISALFGIYLNTRTGPRESNEVSAYSVFNKNCESIDGTLKAEQFEREIRFGSMNVH